MKKDGLPQYLKSGISVRLSLETSLSGSLPVL